MPKLSPSVLESQQEIIRRVANAEKPPVLMNRIAKVAGVDPSMIAKWTAPENSDQREMPWVCVHRLATKWGWSTVLGEDAAEDGFEIVMGDAGGAAVTASALGQLAAEFTAEAAAFTATIVHANADGLLTDEERDDVIRERNQLGAKAWRMCSRTLKVA